MFEVKDIQNKFRFKNKKSLQHQNKGEAGKDGYPSSFTYIPSDHP